METKIAAFQMISSYSFTRPEPILEALNLSGQGVFYQNQLMRLPTNSRLAVYGDLVATRYLCIQWVKTSLTKGQWTQIRSRILSNENLASVGFQKGLDGCLNLNPGTAGISQAMMATTVEAILGAVHLDGGDQALASVMATLGLTSDLLVPLHRGPYGILHISTQWYIAFGAQSDLTISDGQLLKMKKSGKGVVKTGFSPKTIYHEGENMQWTLVASMPRALFSSPLE